MKFNNMSFTKFKYNIAKKGYFVFKKVLPKTLISSLRKDLDIAINLDLKKGYTRGEYSYLAHNKADSFVKLLELSPLQPYIDCILGDTCILHSYNLIRILPFKKNLIQNIIHRDSQRFCRPYLLSMQILYLIDEYTLTNGATYLLPRSHLRKTKPKDNFFWKNADRIIGKAGDAVIFDSLVWHSGGNNTSKNIRRGITKVYTRSFMKQQINMTKSINPEILNKISERSKRLLGFDTRVPNSIKEFLVPEKKRLYKPNQG